MREVYTWSAILSSLLFSQPSTTCASSQGLGSCWNVQDGNIGCDPRKFEDGDHLRCSEKHYPMNWVGRPVYSNAFSLRSGNSENQLNDPTTYRPNEWIDIYLTTHEYTQKFRGLIIHAMSSNMSHVGIWNSTDTSFRSKSKWMNPEPSCIMHRDASLKPLRIHFRFKGPPRGTGNITLKALIKVGPAHRGWFYYPNGRDPNLKGVVPVEGFPGTGNDLILYEAAERNLTWIEGKLGESCNEACNSRGLLCDQQALRDNQLSTPEEIEGKLTGIEFLLPLAASCARVAPAKSVNGLSWYNVANNIDGDRICESISEPREQTTCGSSHPTAQRLCACA